MKTNSLAPARGLAVGLGSVLAWLVATVWSSDEWPWNLAQVTIFLLVTGTCLLALSGKVDATFRWTLAPLLAVVCWGPVQIWLGISIYRYATWTAALAWGTYAGALWIALCVFTHANIARQFRTAAVVFAVVIAVEATVQKFASNGKVLWLIPARRPEAVMGPFLNYDHYAAFVELLLPMALWRAWKDRQRALAWLGAAAVLYGSVIASTSRAGSALVTLEVLIILWIILRHRTTNARSRVVFALIAAGLLVIAALVVGSSILLHRFAENDPLAFRRRTLLVSLRIIQARPWTGFGLGTWPSIYPAYSEYDELAFVNHAHNDWAEWAGDGGVPFAVLMGLVAVRAAWLSLQAPWGIGIVSVFIHSLVDFPLQRPTVMLWLVTILGCLESVRAKETGISGRSSLLLIEKALSAPSKL
jgi:O-antigen ligase